MNEQVGRWARLLVVSIAAIAAVSGAALAQDLTKLRVGKSVTGSVAFSGLEMGQKTGIWKKHGFDIEILSFGGDAQMQQALLSNSIDIGYGSGPGMGFAAKGVPAIAIAAIAGAPLNMALVAAATDDSIKTGEDIKGKRVGVTTQGSLTDWLARQYSVEMGWGKEGVEIVPAGPMKSRLAALLNGEIPVSVSSLSSSYDLEEQGQAKIIALVGDIVDHFHTHVMFAQKELIEKQPDMLKRYLDAWFEIAAYMKANRAETVKNIAEVLVISESAGDKTYDVEMRMLSDDGAFDPRAIELIRESFMDLGILDFVPEASEIYTDQFVPVTR
ncbi:MAG TPA: ABC transporter substrate-binding protein [Rhizobiaceae bacterium]|nr:ABC transporter substrate-binding protein [Rhizobiaceae bacterium]